MCVRIPVVRDLWLRQTLAGGPPRCVPQVEGRVRHALYACSRGVTLGNGAGQMDMYSCGRGYGVCA